MKQKKEQPKNTNQKTVYILDDNRIKEYFLLKEFTVEHITGFMKETMKQVVMCLLVAKEPQRSFFSTYTVQPKQKVFNSKDELIKELL